MTAALSLAGDPAARQARRRHPGVVAERAQERAAGICCVAVLVVGVLITGQAQAGPAAGPLRVHPENPRYFTDGTKHPDGSLKAVYLTGSHVWASLQDMGLRDPPLAFDYPAFLEFLTQRQHNFLRGWIWEMPKWSDPETTGRPGYCRPHPWSRTGPGNAWDGKPKFDLSKFDPSHFDRLRTRAMLARERGIYVSIMLFEGWELKFATWSGHPFHKHNNVNGIDGDPNGDGKGLEIQTLQMPAVVKLQKAYVRKVIDTVNDLDNVLYEISNESSVESWEWQFEMIHYVKAYEATKPKRHPVGMTSDGFGGPDDTDILFRSPADWISPSPDKDDYKNDPPGNSGSKVILLDTDHLWGIGGNRQWVWKSFLRGHNPIWMDPYDEQHPWSPKLDVPANAEAIRKNLGYTRRYAEKMNLTAMTPHSDLASSRYCMANPGKEYLVYLPEGGEVTVDLSAALGEMRSEWFDPATGKSVAGDPVAGGSKRQLTPPFKGEAVLYIVKP